MHTTYETIGAALATAKHRLAITSPSASLDAQVLLAEVLSVSRAHLLAYQEKSLTPDQQAQYAAWVARRAQGEPVAYLLGRRAWYDREFIVTPDVLIPRPETELLLEWALELAKEQPPRAVVDVGTGSGALAVTFAALMPQVHVYAVDVSAAALAVARRNAAAQGLTEGVNITFLHGDLLQPLIDAGLQVEMVLANLPYIARDVVPTLEVSQHEPTLALDGGEDGLTLIHQLLAQAPAVCPPNAPILLEIGADQGAALLSAYPNSELRQDYAGLDRMVCVRR